MLKQWMLEKALISSKKTNEIRKLKLLFYILKCSFRTYKHRSRAKNWLSVSQKLIFFSYLSLWWANDFTKWYVIEAKYKAMTTQMRFWKAWMKRRQLNGLFIMQYYKVKRASSNFLNRRNSIMSSNHKSLSQHLIYTTQSIMRHETRITIYIFNRKMHKFCVPVSSWCPSLECPSCDSPARSLLIQYAHLMRCCVHATDSNITMRMTHIGAAVLSAALSSRPSHRRKGLRPWRWRRIDSEGPENGERVENLHFENDARNRF